MGWHIVRREASDDLRRYSRLWLSQDISELLTDCQGTDKIEGEALNFRAATDVKISSEAFTHMTKLRLLKIHNANASQVPSFLPCELRWLDWHGYPSKCLPVLDNLKFINLSYSQKLIRTPDFTAIPNLERLILEECTSLVEIHASVGFLKNLVLLNLKHCINLKRLPKSIHLEKLKMLILSGCLKLQTFPEIAGHMACLLEVYAEATALRELPSSIDFLTHLSLINLSYCKHLASLPSSICRLKGLKTLVLSGCSQFDKLPYELGQMDCLEVLYCDDTAIQKPPSSISLLKNLKTLSFRGCKPLASQSWCSSLLSWLLPGTFRDTKASPFLSISGLSSLKKLDLSDCSMLDGGVPCDLGVLSTLEELNLGKNKFVSIPAEIIAQLTRLKVLELVGCQKLETLPDLPSSIAEVYADECTALKSNLDLLTKYPKLFRVSFTKCARLFQDQGDNHMVDALWQHLLKGLSVVDDNFSICLPGIEIPEWFTYKNSGPSIAVSLPQNWYNNKFMGFAVCVVSDLTSTSLSGSINYLKKTHGIRVLFSFRTRGGRNLSYGINIGSIGSDENVDSEHTCLAYVSFDSFWWVYNKMVHSPNEWCQVEVSADRFTRGHLLLTGFGMRLVYEDDVEQQMNQNKLIQSDGKMGLFPAIFNGSKYVKKKRLGYYDFSRLPPEAQHQDS
nr:TMV resistance protein N-like [Ipomoea batatas]